MLKKMTTLSTVGSLLILTACSGGGSGSGTNANPPSNGGASYGQAMEAQFIDAPVKGLKFITEGGVTSQTGNEGKFSCKRGELVSFKLGQIDLGYSACGEKIFVHDLVSSASGFSWGKVAAILQTFSVDEGSYLDLSAVKQADLNLSGISFSSADSALATALGTALTASSAAYSDVDSEKVPAAAVTVAAAQTAANGALTDSIKLSDDLQSVLAQLSVTGAPKIILTGKLISETLIEGYEDTCWKNIKAKSSVVANNGQYTFNVDSAASYDDNEAIGTDLNCIAGAEDNDECESHTAAQLPQPKIITNGNISMVFSHSFSMSGTAVTTRNALTINTSIVQDAVNFSGIFENKMTAESGELKGKSMLCKYEVTASQAVETGSDEEDEEQGGEEGPVASEPVAGTFVGGLACNTDPSSSLDVTVTITAGTPFQAAFEITGSAPWSIPATDLSRDMDSNEWMVESTHSDAGAPFDGEVQLFGAPVKEGGVDKFEVSISNSELQCIGSLAKE